MKQESKRFFFEKKKQKTFAKLGPFETPSVQHVMARLDRAIHAFTPAAQIRRQFHQHGLEESKFFLLLFCSQKRSSYTNHHGFRPMAEDRSFERKSWMPAFAGMTWGGQRVKTHAGWYDLASAP